MKNDGQDFLEELTASTPQTFEGRFEILSERLNLGRFFSRNELTLLHEAALRAMLCNAALNGADVNASSEPHRERCRRSHELAFLEARDVLFASPGWQELPLAEQQGLTQAFLSVRVADHHLLW